MKEGLNRANTFWRKKDKYSRQKVFVEAHRGGMALEPENTIRAYKNVIALGCDSIELDIWLTKDNKLIVIHGTDDTGDISATANGKGKPIDLTSQDLSAFTIGKGEHIPLLEEVCDLCKGKIFLNIEVKSLTSSPEIISILINLLIKHGMEEHCAISSLDHKLLDFAAKYPKGKNFELIYNYDQGSIANPLPNIDYICSHGNVAELCFSDISPSIVNALHNKGMGVSGWVSCDMKEEEWYKKLIDCGIDVLCVNNPANLLKHLS